MLELFDDPSTTGTAAAHPQLPVPVRYRVLTDAATLADGAVEGEPTAYLGRWTSGQLPPNDD